MPWQVIDNGLMLSGRILDWAADFEEWYLEDIRGVRVCPDFGGYILLLVDGYLRLAKLEAGNPAGIVDAPGADANIPDHECENSGLPLTALDELDRLAETFDDDFRIRLSGGAREWAKGFML